MYSCVYACMCACVCEWVHARDRVAPCGRAAETWCNAIGVRVPRLFSSAHAQAAVPAGHDWRCAAAGAPAAPCAWRLTACVAGAELHMCAFSGDSKWLAAYGGSDSKLFLWKWNAEKARACVRCLALCVTHLRAGLFSHARCSWLVASRRTRGSVGCASTRWTPLWCVRLSVLVGRCLSVLVCASGHHRWLVPRRSRGAVLGSCAGGSLRRPRAR